MHKTKTELYGLVKDIKTKKDFEKELKTRYKSYDGLLDEETIALLMVDELGRNKQSINKIAELEMEKEYTVVGTVRSLSDARTFKRKNGTAGKVINLEISDDTGTCRLVLWNEDIDHIKKKEIQPGTIVKIINGYTKRGFTGLEIHLGRWGLLEVEPVNASLLKESRVYNGDEIIGTLVSKEATRAFFKDNGEFGFVTTIILNDNGKEKRIILWDRSVKEIQQCKKGEKIILKNVTRKQSNGTTEYHVNGNSSIQKCN
jgi:ssDNA-binding replication factor A large subunit